MTAPSERTRKWFHDVELRVFMFGEWSTFVRNVIQSVALAAERAIAIANGSAVRVDEIGRPCRR